MKLQSCWQGFKNPPASPLRARLSKEREVLFCRTAGTSDSGKVWNLPRGEGIGVWNWFDSGRCGGNVAPFISESRHTSITINNQQYLQQQILATAHYCKEVNITWINRSMAPNTRGPPKCPRTQQTERAFRAGEFGPGPFLFGPSHLIWISTVTSSWFSRSTVWEHQRKAHQTEPRGAIALQF